MRTGDVAKMMGVTQQTIVNWTQRPELTSYFSKQSLRDEQNTAQRDFDESDVRVLNTIRVMKMQRLKWEEIAERLAKGDRELELPMGAYITKTISAAEQVSQMMAIKNELNNALMRVSLAEERAEKLEKENAELRATVMSHKEITYQQLSEELKKSYGQLEQERKQTADRLEQERNRVNEEKMELYKRIMALEFELQQTQSKPPEKKKYYTED